MADPDCGNVVAAPGAVHTFWLVVRVRELPGRQALWEEGVNRLRTAMGTASFNMAHRRMLTKGARFGCGSTGAYAWQDLQWLAIEATGSFRHADGQNPKDSADLVFQLPAVPPDWHF